MQKLMTLLDEHERLNKLREPWRFQWSQMLSWIEQQIVEGLGDPARLKGPRFTMVRGHTQPFGFPLLELTLTHIPGTFRFVAVEGARDEEGDEGEGLILYGDLIARFYEEGGKWYIVTPGYGGNPPLTGDALADTLMDMIHAMEGM